MISFKEFRESITGTIKLGQRTKDQKPKQPKEVVKSSKAIDRDDPRYNTNVRGSSMLHSDAHHDIIDTSHDTGLPIFGLKEKSHGTTFKYSSHFMGRVNNSEEVRNKHIDGDFIKKVKDAVKQHMDAGNIPKSSTGVVKRIFVAKNGYKFPVRIEHDSVHFKTLLAPNMKTDHYQEPRVFMGESVDDFSDYETVELGF